MNNIDNLIKALTNENISSFSRYCILKNSNKFTDDEICYIQEYLIKQKQEEQIQINKGIVQKTIEKAIDNVLKDFE